MRILLLSPEAEDQKTFQAVAQAAGMPLLAMADAHQVCAELQKDQSAIVVVDAGNEERYRGFEKAVADSIGLFSAIINVNALFYLSSLDFHECPYLAKSEIFGTFIQRPLPTESIPQLANLFKQVVAERAFGLEKYFGSGAKVQSIKIVKTLQKKVLLESFKNHLIQIGFKSRMAAVISTAADELIMNAIFDAPVDELGKHIYAQTARNSDFDLDEKSSVEMRVAYDGKTLGVSVIDQHGSLDKKKLLNQHLVKSYENNQYENKPMSAGAGLGLSQVYRNCGGLVFVCETGNRTEVTLFFKKTDSFREFKDQFRFLSTFMYFS